MINSNALKWSFLSELAAKLIPMVVFVVLASLLTPEDFGVMSAAMMTIAFSQIFWEAGMGKALIQWQDDIEDAANAAFWINVILGCLIATMLYLSSKPIALGLFRDERVASVLRVMTVYVVLGAISAVHISLLQRQMKFKQLFWVRFATVSLPGLASIPLAWFGLGYWSLVMGTLAGQFAQVIVLWRINRWRPKIRLNPDVAKQIAQFGAWVATSSLLGWFYFWADALVVGIYLGSHELGLYRTGNQFATMIFIAMFGPVMPVLFSHISRMNRDKERLAQAVEKVIKALILTAIPVAFIVFSLAEPIAAALFGEKWKGIGLVIGAMALMQGYSWVVGMNGEFYRAMGKPSYETIVTTATLVIYLGAYLISIQEGFQEFIWTRLGLALGALLLHMFVLRKLLSVTLLPLARYLLVISLLSALIVTIVQLVTNQCCDSSWSRLLVSGTSNVVVLGLTIFILERNSMLKEIFELVRKRKA